MKESLAVDRVYGNPYIGPYGGLFPYDQAKIRDLKKYASDDEWESWAAESPYKKKKKNAALSALTLVAFLFFLNLLQTCLKEQMMAMNPTVSEKIVFMSRTNGVFRLDYGDDCISWS